MNYNFYNPEHSNDKAGISKFFWSKLSSLNPKKILIKMNIFDPINKLQEILNSVWDNGGDLEQIFNKIKENEYFFDSQDLTNNQVNEKLSIDAISEWKPVQFFLLADEQMIEILGKMSRSNKEFQPGIRKIINFKIKKLLLNENYDVGDLIQNIPVEQMKYLDNNLMNKISIDNIKKFDITQIKHLQKEPFKKLLDRLKSTNEHSDCLRQIYNNIAELPDDLLDTIVANLPDTELHQLSSKAVKKLYDNNLLEAILKKSYESHQYLQPNQFEDLSENIIPNILNSHLQKQENAKDEQTDNLEHLIYYISGQQITKLTPNTLKNLPTEAIKTLILKQSQYFSSGQCLILLARNDCKDDVINSLSSDQIYGMDFKQFKEWPKSDITKLINKKQAIFFGEDGVNNSQNSNNVAWLINFLLSANEFDDKDKNFVLQNLTEKHLELLSSETLKYLIEKNKITKLKTMPTKVLPKWFGLLGMPEVHLKDNQLQSVQQEKLIDNDTEQLALNLIKQLNKTNFYKKNENKRFGYLLRLYAIYIKDQELQSKIKSGKKFETSDIKYLSEDSIKNISQNYIKMLDRESINLIITNKKLQYFSDKQLDWFELDEGIIQSLPNEAIEALRSSENGVKCFLNKFISYFTNKQLKVLLENGDEFLGQDVIAKINTKILFSDNQDDKKGILHQIDILKLDFSSLCKSSLCKNGYLPDNICQKFSNDQINKLIQSENIKYVDPVFLARLGNKQIKTFNTQSLTETQITALNDNNKFQYLNAEIIKNQSVDIVTITCFSRSQIEKLIDKTSKTSKNEKLSLSDSAIQNIGVDLLGDVWEQMPLEGKNKLIENLVKNDIIGILKTPIFKTLTPYHVDLIDNGIKLKGPSSFKDKLDQSTKNSLIDGLIEGNTIFCLNNLDSLDIKITDILTPEQIQKIDSIVDYDSHKSTNSEHHLSINSNQLVALSQCSAFKDIKPELLGNINSYFIGKLTLKNMTLDQINALFQNDNVILNENQIKDLFDNKSFNSVNNEIIENIGSSISPNLLSSLDLTNMDYNTAKTFFDALSDRKNIKLGYFNRFFENIENNTNDKVVNLLVKIPSFEKFYLSNYCKSAKKLDEVILSDKKFNFTKNKLFLRMIQHRLSNPSNSTKNEYLETNMSPQVEKKYKTFIQNLDINAINKFYLDNVDNNFVKYLPTETLTNPGLVITSTPDPIKNKLKKEKKRIEWWINLLNYFGLGNFYKRKKQTVLSAIEEKINKHEKTDEIPKADEEKMRKTSNDNKINPLDMVNQSNTISHNQENIHTERSEEKNN